MVAIIMLSDRLETFTSELLTTFFNLLPFVVTSLLSIIRCYPKSPVSGGYVAHAQTVDTRPIFSAASDRG